jgi:hypothetical protein
MASADEKHMEKEQAPTPHVWKGVKFRQPEHPNQRHHHAVSLVEKGPLVAVANCH